MSNKVKLKKSKGIKNYEVPLEQADGIIMDPSSFLKIHEESGYPDKLQLPDWRFNLHVYVKIQTAYFKDFKKLLKEGSISFFAVKNGATYNVDTAYITSAKDFERVIDTDDLRTILVFADDNDILTVYGKTGIISFDEP